MWSEKLANGKVRYVERYEDFMTGEERKVSVTFDKDTAANRKTALQALNYKIAEQDKETPAEDVTLGYLIKEYRKDQKVTVKPSTYTRNYHTCETFKTIFGKDTLVRRLTARLVRSKLIGTGKDAGTLNEYLKRLKALIRWGYRNDLVEDISWLGKLDLFKDTPHRTKIQDKYLEKSELKALLAAMDNTKWRLLTEFFALSGLRFGEAAALLLSDVDLKNRTISITKGYDSVNKITTAMPKTEASIRDIYIQDELLVLCKKIRKYFGECQIYLQYRTKLFFADERGKNLSLYAYDKYLKDKAAEILGKKITAHALRHTHASLLMEQGVQIDAISRRLGHENSRVTREIYLHVTAVLTKQDNDQLKNIKLM